MIFSPMAYRMLPLGSAGRLGERHSRSQRRWAAEQLGEPPQVLRGGSEQDLIPCAAQATQAKPIEPEDALHVCKAHLDLLALAP